MDWLRSEDLKEEKNVTASVTSIAGGDLWHFGAQDESANARRRREDTSILLPKSRFMSAIAMYLHLRLRIGPPTGRSG
jgi:hypothetical protein